MVRPVSASSISAGPISASDASLSPDGRYRWWLRRRWATEGRSLLFIGLNPSKADAKTDDPTLRRLIGFAKRWGYGELLVLNLFARRSPHPAALRTVTDPVGDRNDAVLLEQAERWSRQSTIDLWLGWGAQGTLHQRNRRVLQLLDPFRCRRRRQCNRARGALTLGLTRSGQPRHPLYARRDGMLQPMVWAESGVISHPEFTPPGLHPN